jgi:predicted ATP-grasp superfamily ATP-dependent carboligase
LLRPLSELRPLRDPVFLCAFAGRGGGSAAAAVQYLVDQWGATAVAELDSEEAFDFTVRRPVVRLEGDQRVVNWPKNEFFVFSPVGLDRDFILMPGIEPHMRWKAFCDALVECLEALGCRTAVILGSRSGALPHTRPVPFRLVTTDPAFGRAFGVEASFSNYEGPTGITTVINERFGRAGIAAASLSAMTPFYVNAEPNPKAVIALVEAIDRAYGTDTPSAILREKAADVDRAAEDAADQSAELRQAIGSLEQQYDFARGNTAVKPGADPTAAELPTGSEAVAQLEEFLRELRGPGGGPAASN